MTGTARGPSGRRPVGDPGASESARTGTASRRSRLRPLWPVAALALVAAIWGLAPERKVGSARVEERTLRLTVEVAGVLEAVETAHIGAPQVRRYGNLSIVFLAPEGSAVEAGQPILGLDTSQMERWLVDDRSRAQRTSQELEKRRHELAVDLEDFDLRIAEARSTLARAELKVDVPESIVAERELEAARLDERIGRQRLDSLEAQRGAREQAVRTELIGLERQREEARRRVAELEDAIARMTVVAPRAGTVLYLDQRRGRGLPEKPKVGDTTWPGATLLEIPSLEAMRAAGTADEVELGRLREGQRVRVRLDAHPESEYSGRVARVGHTVFRESEAGGRKVVAVHIDLDRVDRERMRPGMRFRGEIETARRDGVVAVPLEAVIATAEGPRVRVRRGWRWRDVAVELGERDGRYAEVLRGLGARDRVALPRTGAEAG